MFSRIATKAVDVAWNTPANRHVSTVWYVLLVYMRGLEFHAPCARDTIGVRHVSINTKIKHKVKVRAHVNFVGVAARVAL